jgi:8-oxo-dGTP diphosphatase
VVYDGVVRTASDIEASSVQKGELSGFAFVRRDQLANRVTPLLARRIAACLGAMAAAPVASLEDGSPVS